MFYVTSLDGSQVEPLINIGTDFKMEQTTDGTFTVSFSCFPTENNPGYDLLKSETIVTVEGCDFKVKQFSETIYSKSIVGISTFFEFSKVRKNDIYGGTRTLNEYIAFLLGQTNWTYSIDGTIATKSVVISNFGNDNIISLINILCKMYECEYIILPNNHVHFAPEVGPDDDFQYRYKHNIESVVLKEDTTNLYTVITGHGANSLSVTYRSPYADVFGELEAEPVEDDRFTDAEALTEYIKTSLTDVPELAIETEVAELTHREIGERIWLIYEPLNVEFQTRIIKQTKVLVDGNIITKSVIFGNVIPQSSMDILISQKAEINENNKISKSRFEQTNERITLAVERLDGEIVEAKAEFTITADEIRAEVVATNVAIEEGLAQNRSLISQTAAQIRSEVASDVQRLDGSIASLSSSITQTATQIRSEVNNEVKSLNGRIDSSNSSITQLSNSITAVISEQSSMNGRMSSAESSISQQASQITSKVSYTDYTGANLVSMINQTPLSIKLHAKNIEMQGAVSVLSDITGNMGTITAGTLNLHNAIYVGDGVHLRGSGRTGLYFPSWSQIFDTSGTMTIESYNSMALVGASLDLSNIRGSINWGSHKPVAVWG